MITISKLELEIFKSHFAELYSNHLRSKNRNYDMKQLPKNRKKTNLHKIKTKEDENGQKDEKEETNLAENTLKY